MKKRFLMTAISIVFVGMLTFVGGIISDDASVSASAATGFSIDYPTQEEIRQRYQQYPFSTSSSVTYTSNYSTTAPYKPGKISDKDKKEALNALNFCRFIAGLPDDVKISEEYNDYAQAAALVNAVNGKLSHYPSQPSGMSDDLYQKGAYGASHSNIGVGYTNIANSITEGYMEDSDSSNIDRVGHRRWILNPYLQYVGFGMVENFTATYVTDENRADTFLGDYVAWPPKNMPVELYSSFWGQYAFSVTLGEDYDYPKLDYVTVEVHSQKLNKTWHLNSNSRDYTNYLNVENSYYGMPKCIIFNVGEMFTAGDKVSVKINGITKGGVSSPISYDVNFFEIEHTHNYKSKITKAATCSSDGIKTYTCEVCGKSYTETIPKLRHSFSYEWTIDKQPTCTSEGSKSYHCTKCGEKSNITSIPKTEHTYTSKITRPATCTTEGIKTLTCSVCGYSTTEKIPKTEHKYISNTTKEATCTENGVRKITCEECSDMKTEIIPAKGHDFGEYKIKEEPTAEKDGVKERVCKNCGEVETEVIPKLTLNGTSETATSTESMESSSSTKQDAQTSSESTGEISSTSSVNSASVEQESQVSSSTSESSAALGETEDSSETPEQVENDNQTVLIIVICAAAAVIIATVTIIIVKKRKK